jgi:phage baseplate assembly protein W
MSTHNLADDPVGVGISFPIKFENGRTALTSSTRVPITGDGGIGDDSVDSISRVVPNEPDKKRVVRQAMARTVLTAQGARFMEGLLGSLVDLVPFEVNDVSTHDAAVAFATIAIIQQERRVEILDASASKDSEDENAILGVIVYKILTEDITDAAVVFERSDV